jgi:hypothetical protein
MYGPDGQRYSIPIEDVITEEGIASLYPQVAASAVVVMVLIHMI